MSAPALAFPMVTQSESDPRNPSREPPSLSDARLVGLAVLCALGARSGEVAWVRSLARLRPLGFDLFRLDVVGAVLLLVAVLRWGRGLGPRSRRAQCGIVLGLLLFVGVRASAAIEGTEHVVAGAWSGTAILLRDPDTARFGTRVEALVEGRHLTVRASGDVGLRLARLAAGQRFQGSGRIAALTRRSAWTISRHLAGDLHLHTLHRSDEGSPIARVANGIRGLVMRSGSSLSPAQRPLFNGFVLGDDRGQRPEVTEDFRAAGLSHLLVVSGQNVAFLLALFGPALRSLGIRGRFVVTALLLAVFGLVTRFDPSVLRAIAMAGVTLLATTSGRPQRSLRVLALAVVLLLLIDPLLAWSVSFGLSVGACVGLALIPDRLEPHLWGPAWLRQSLATTLAAQLGTAPLLGVFFGGVPVVAPLANLAALPAAAPILGWGIALTPIAAVHPGAAAILHLPTRLLLGWIAGVARVSASLPLGSIGFRGAAVLLVVAAAVRNARRPVVWILVASLLVPAGFAVAGQRVEVRAQGVSSSPPVAHGISRSVDVLIVRHGADIARTLEALRTARVRRIGLLVVQSGGRPQTALVAAIASRVPVGVALIATPSLATTRADWQVARPGMLVRSGQTLVSVDDVDGNRISVRIGPMPAAPSRPAGG